MSVLDLHQELGHSIVRRKRVHPDLRKVGPGGHHALQGADVLGSEQLGRLQDKKFQEANILILYLFCALERGFSSWLR